MKIDDLIVIRGGGDIATGIIQKFHRSGFKIVVLECSKPTSIRRSVSVSEAIYDGESHVEDMHCVKINSLSEINECFKKNIIPLLVDESATSVEVLKPNAVIDCIIAKKNLGTNKSMSEITIALGPGFCAGKDVDVVIETMRGHDLGRLIFNGEALKNTNIPGVIDGKSNERVVHAPNSGVIKHVKKIGDIVDNGEVLFYIDEAPVFSPISGILRGLIREGLEIEKGLKIADVDPRKNVDYRTISDKARCLGGSALEAYFYLKK